MGRKFFSQSNVKKTLFLSSDHHAAMVRASTEDCVEVKPADALVKKVTAQRIVFAPNVSRFSCYP